MKIKPNNHEREVSLSGERDEAWIRERRKTVPGNATREVKLNIKQSNDIHRVLFVVELKSDEARISDRLRTEQESVSGCKIECVAI